MKGSRRPEPRAQIQTSRGECPSPQPAGTCGRPWAEASAGWKPCPFLAGMSPHPLGSRCSDVAGQRPPPQPTPVPQPHTPDRPGSALHGLSHCCVPGTRELRGRDHLRVPRLPVWRPPVIKHQEEAVAPDGLGMWPPPPAAAGASKNRLLVLRLCPHTHAHTHPLCSWTRSGRFRSSVSLWFAAEHVWPRGRKSPCRAVSGHSAVLGGGRSPNKQAIERGEEAALPHLRGTLVSALSGLRLPLVSRGAGGWPHAASAMPSTGSDSARPGRASCLGSSWWDRAAAGLACWQRDASARQQVLAQLWGGCAGSF